MERRTCMSDIITIALLYRKEYAGTDMISYQKIIKYDEIINKNLDEMGAKCGSRFGYENSEFSEFYMMLKDERGNICAVINPNADLKKKSDSIFGYLPIEIIVATQMDNALKEIDLITVDDKIIDRNNYYNHLAEKYHLRGYFKKQEFDIFRDWERIPENGFVESYCISLEEKKILYELRKNRDINSSRELEQVTRIKRVKKL